MVGNANTKGGQHLWVLLPFVGNSCGYTAYKTTLVHMPREILVDWTTPAGGGFRSVMYFDAAIAVAGQRAALNTFLSGVDGLLEEDVSWQIETSGRDVDNASGTLLAVWTDMVVYTGQGGVDGEVVADATQVLFKWITGVIINGRFLTGRTFIPGLDVGGLVDGNFAQSLATPLQVLGDALCDAGVGFGVWHRPTAGSGGSFATATKSICNTELAVLRRRRN